VSFVKPGYRVAALVVTGGVRKVIEEVV